MTVEQIVGLVLALLVMLFGVIGSLVPVMPGVPVIVVAALGHRLYFGDHGASWWVLAVMTVLAVIALALDYVAGMIGAKKLGATWRGIVGAVVGGLVGLFFSLPGILLGPFVGALLFELAGGREFKLAAKAGAGAVLGLFAGAVGKLALCMVMILLFTTNVIYRAAS
jgi:uncharacterized protein YqgC (DUF456 family)